MKKLFLSLACLLLAAVSAVHAADPSSPTSQADFLASLHFEQGDISLPGNIATLKMPPSFRYLAPADAEKVLVQAWGNPPGSHTLGMIVPADVGPTDKNGWGVIVTYEKDGHVKDDDADSIKYDKLLKEMQESIAEENPERKKAGFGTLNLVGWAETPHYDKASHKLYWAKEVHFDDTPGNTLNYNVRVLGREGVLVLNAVAGMDQLSQVKTEMAKVTAFADFTSGNRYADFNGKTDKVAEYGLAALVAGGVAAKLGFFGKLLALLLMAKKLVIVGIGAIGIALKKWFGRDKESGSGNDVDVDAGPKVDLEKR
ncbi:MAG: DUF2167 domain-containing protein [Massilia sp.]